MSVTNQNRNIGDLHKVAQEACRLFLAECDKAGVKVFITETHRSQERQDWLYAQGRTRPGSIVTNTRNSNHKDGMAWDIAVSPPLSLYDAKTMDKAGAVARKIGITWGGDWKGFVDRPHFEVKATWKARELPAPPKEEQVDMANLFKPTSAALFNSVDGVLQRLEKMDKPLNVSWRKKLHNGELTDSDAIGLLFVAAERGQLTK